MLKAIKSILTTDSNPPIARRIAISARQLLRNKSFRTKRFIYFASTTVVVKSLTMISSLISVPLTYNYLDEQQFGLMTTIVTAMSLLSFTDLGVGFGLQNNLPKLLTAKDELNIRKHVSNTFILLSLTAFTVGIISYAALIILESNYLANHGYVENLTQSSKSVATLLFFILVGIPLSLVQRFQVGAQEGHISQIWNAAGNLLGLIGLLIVIGLHLGLPWIFAALYGLPQLVLALNFIHFFGRRYPQYAPKFGDFDRAIGKWLLRIGSIILISQIAASILTASTNLIIADQLGTAEVADISIITRFTIILSTPIILIISAILPSINDAFAHKDNRWIKKTIRISGLVTGAYALAIIFIYTTSGKYLLKLWIGKEIEELNTLFIPALFYMIYLLANAWISYIMMSTEYLRSLFRIYPAAVLVAVAGKYICGIKFGAVGIIWAEIIVMSALFFIPSLWLIKKSKHI